MAGAKRGGWGGREKSPSPFPLPPYPLFPTPFDACYAGYCRLTIKPLTKVLLRTTPTGTIMLHLLLKNFCIFASFPSISPASRLPYHSGPLLSRAAVPICPTPQARFLFSFYRLFFLSTVSLLVECLSTSSCREEGLAQRTESRV